MSEAVCRNGQPFKINGEFHPWGRGPMGKFAAKVEVNEKNLSLRLADLYIYYMVRKS